MKLEDPYDFWERYFDRECMKTVARVMKACGVTQVDISNVDLMSSDEIAVEHADGFLRIKGKFEIAK